MQRFGLTVDANAVNAKNTAAVMVTAELPPFAKPGQKIDVTVAALSKATSLRGGSLLITQLIGSDNETYAVAQGNLAVGGLGITGNDGSKVAVNVPTVGRIPGGATVERMVSNPFETAPVLMLNLKENQNVQGGTPTVVNQNQVVQGQAGQQTQNSQISVDAPPARTFLFAPDVQLSSIVDAINAVGASPSDIVAILEALKQAGALHADLVVI
jgi:flagellar P-ring protein precursor FlgI